ncbi:MAG: AmmeMemoRadiSam system radical SAM enzyme [Candidatus Omnitrophica bacterium]|nr:AmmeMemoRadiSam system radical SAM enzyme [Candidatus Omnitrophota bacterium]
MRKEAVLWDSRAGRVVHCRLCAHGCKILPDSFGICGVRGNVDGVLYTYAYGKIIASHVDPIQKKPFYHFLPGTTAYSIAAAGCNFKCSFCQNWKISQVVVELGELPGKTASPEQVVSEAIKNKCRSISYTYTEPTVFFEYAHDISVIAKENGLKNSFVTNGFMSPDAIDTISPYLDAANIDLKFFNDGSYKKICNGRLEPVLASIRRMKEKGIWVEVTTLIIPGVNDSDKELGEITDFLSEIGKEIPWHISRFHPDHKLTEMGVIPVKTLKHAAEIGKKAGLKYVYLGNVHDPGDTVCSSCGAALIERSGFKTRIPPEFLKNGKCALCRARIEGVWA